MVLTKNGSPNPNGVTTSPKTKKCNFTWATLYVVGTYPKLKVLSCRIMQFTTENLLSKFFFGFYMTFWSTLWRPLRSSEVDLKYLESAIKIQILIAFLCDNFSKIPLSRQKKFWGAPLGPPHFSRGWVKALKGGTLTHPLCPCMPF